MAEWDGGICSGPASDRSVRNANVTDKSNGCLNLNNIIWPSLATVYSRSEKLPGAVSLYGAGFGADLNHNFSCNVQGSVAQGMPTMAVTLNYRTGFLDLPGGKAVARGRGQFRAQGSEASAAVGA